MSAALCLAVLSELKLITVRSVLFILPDEINNALLERVGGPGGGNNWRGTMLRGISKETKVKIRTYVGMV